MPNVEAAKKKMMVEADMLTWMAVHGNLLLALRHPGNTGDAADIVRLFAGELGRMLVEGGIISQAELEFVCLDQEKAVRSRQ